MYINHVKIIDNFPLGFAYHEVLTDDKDMPIDYRLIEVNGAFEKLTGLNKKEVLNRKITDVIPEVTQRELDLISTYANVVKTGESVTFKEYFDTFNQWFEVTAFSDREGYFSTIFRDITMEVLEKKALEEIVDISETCLHHDHEILDYKKVSRAVRKISRGKQVGFYLYQEDLMEFKEVAIAGKKIYNEDNDSEYKTYIKKIEKGGRVFGELRILLKSEEKLQNEEHLQVLTGILGQYFDRQQKQLKLQREKQQMFLLFDQMEAPTYVVDMETYEIIYVNEAGNENFGDVVGKICWEVLHPGLKEACSYCPIPELKKEKGPLIKKRKEYYHARKKRWYRRTDTAIDWPDGRRVKLTVAYDVSDGKKAEMQQHYLLTLMENAHDSIIVTDENFTITYVNKKTEELFGYETSELLGKKVRSIYSKDEVKRVQEEIFPILKSKKKYTGEVITKRKDGSSFFCEISVSPIEGNEENPRGYIGIQRDVTEKKLMIQKLNSSKDRYEELAKQSGTVTWETDQKGRYTYLNPVVKDVFGYSPEELVGKVYFYDIFIEEDKAMLKEKFFEIFANKKPFRNVINSIEGKNGETVVVSTNGMPILNKAGEITGYKGMDVDITDRVLLEEQRDLEQEKFKTTLLSVGDGIIATDKQGNIAMMNRVAEYLTEWTQKEAYGQPFDKVFNIIHEGTKKSCKNPVKHVLKTGETIELEENTALLTKTGKAIPIEDSAAPIKGKDGEVTGAVIVFRDYSEKREKEQEVQYLSFHDHLTGLYNRRYMDDAIERLDNKASLPIAIIAVDVNGLKLTNDAYGHDMGDKLLKAVAAVLRKASGKNCIIARISGDEFVILLSQITATRTESVMRRIKSLSQRIDLDSVIVSLAMGYAIKTEEDQSLWKVLKDAENRMYKNKMKHGKLMRSKTIETVLRSINLKYDKEQIHTERVSLYCEAIAKALGLPEQEIENIKTIGVLHDIGKITVSPELLNKKEKLTDEEWNQVKQHPVMSYNILKGVEEYMAFADAVLHHHERWDGGGYPAGLKGKEIPYYARIVTVADAFEAMTAQRSYQKAKTNEEASKELKRCAGTQFDPEIVDLFIDKVIKE